MQKNFKRALFLLAVALIATGAGAVTMIPMSTAEMTTEAVAIVVGECVSGTSQWVDGALMTLIDIEVDDTLKGSGVSELTLVIPGGIDADRPVPIAVTYPGAPTVFQGETVLMFLSPSSAVSGAYSIVGFAQGLFSVEEESATKQLVTKQRVGGKAVSLEAMKAEIRRALED